MATHHPPPGAATALHIPYVAPGATMTTQVTCLPSLRFPCVQPHAAKRDLVGRTTTGRSLLAKALRVARGELGLRARVAEAAAREGNR